MELYQLRQLLAVAKYGTLSAAANVLNISQPALTRSMQKLEQALSVTLFDRKRNRIELNEAGKLAVEHARQITGAADRMMEQMRAYRRSQTTVAIGACAPGPMWVVASELILLLSGKTITSEVREGEVLLSGLRAGEYQLIIVDRPVEEDQIICQAYVTEQLYLSLPPAHPLHVKPEGIWLSELEGQTMLLYAELGVWKRVCEEKMGQVHFIVQEKRDVFEDLVHASYLPSFTTNLTRQLVPHSLDRVEIPIRDPEASMPFYLCVLKKDRRILEQISARSP